MLIIKNKTLYIYSTLLCKDEFFVNHKILTIKYELYNIKQKIIKISIA